MKKTMIIMAVIFGVVLVIGIITQVSEEFGKSAVQKIEKRIEKAVTEAEWDACFTELETISNSGSEDAEAATHLIDIKDDLRLFFDIRNLEYLAKIAQKKFPEQFNEWNGSNIHLVDYIKKQMHNPKSFKHTNTQWEYGDQYKYIRVKMNYSGANMYNAVVQESIIATIDIDGVILTVE